MTSFYRQIVSQLQALFQENPQVLAAWEGGSAATGYLDEYSDLDLGVIAKDDSVESVFQQVEECLEHEYGIAHVFCMPEPSWHGHSQRFYLLKDAPEFFYVDLLIEKESAGNRFLEQNRHGKAIAWLDRADFIDQTPMPEELIQKQCHRHFSLITAYMPFMVLDIKKQIVRGNIIDALAIYGGFMNRFAFLLNIKYRPAKFDFGLRYYYRDLPKDVVALVEDALLIGSLEALSAKLEKVLSLYEKLVVELREQLEVR